MGRPAYSNLIYGFDIETSTIFDTDGVKKSFMYIGQFGRLNVNSGQIERAHIIRTWAEFDEYMEQLDRLHELRGDTALLYVHNNYEWNFIQYNSKWFINSIMEGRYEALFKASTRPLTVRISHIELRDSLILLNKSIKMLGDEFNIPKLEYDYDVVRYPTDELQPLDLEYNWRDVEIALTAIYDLYTTEPYITSPKDIPLTQTGRTRKNNETDPRIVFSGSKPDQNMTKAWQAKCRREFPKCMEELQSEIAISKGGFVHANGYFVGQDCNTVHSFDLASAHPAQELNRYVPAELPAIAEDPVETYNSIISKIINGYDIIKEHRPDYTLMEYLMEHPDFTKLGYHGTFVLTNVHVKEWDMNYMATISISKCSNAINPVIDNGRILHAECIEIAIDFVSMMQYMLTYDFEVDDVKELWYYKVGKAHQFAKACVKVYALEKTSYKTARNFVRDNKRCIDVDGLLSAGCTDDKAINHILSISDWHEQMLELEKYLMLAKQKLNAQYGINMQNPINEDWEPVEIDGHLDWQPKEVTWDDVAGATHKNNYLFGVYIPIYTQLAVTCCTVMMYYYHPEAKVLYWDTDSMKVMGDYDDCMEVVDRFNEAWTRGALRVNGELFEGLGLMDYEKTYDHFSSIGCKRYLALEGDYMHATISGMTKASEVYQRIFNQCHSFQTILDKCFKLNTEFTISAVEGLESYYGQAGSYIEKLNDGTRSGVVLDKAPFYMNKIIGDSKSEELNRYYHLVLQKIFNNPVNTKKMTITRNKKGEYLCNRRIIR